MLALKVALKKAEKAKRFLLARGALARGKKAFREEGYVFFPLSKRVGRRYGVFTEQAFTEVRRGKSLRETAKGFLTKKELDLLVSSFDVVGDIAVLEVPARLKRKAKKIAQALLESQPRVKTVLFKSSPTKGVFRLRGVKWLAGEKKTATTHKESGCVFRVDLARVYFSPRLSHERLRVASQVKPGERVLALFAGVGPYPLVIAKRKDAKVAAVELNPVAVRLLKENLSLNKLRGRVEVVAGEARRVVKRKRFKAWADRVLMPLPFTAGDFLDAVLPCCRKGCVVHFYGIGAEPDPFAESLKRIRFACKNKGLSCRVKARRRVHAFAPRVSKIAVDFTVY